MSYQLDIFSDPIPQDNEAKKRTIEQEHVIQRPEDIKQLDEEKLLKLYIVLSKILKKFPIEPRQSGEETVWSARPEVGKYCISLQSSFSVTREILPYVKDIATNHGCWVSDPQTGEIFRPINGSTNNPLRVDEVNRKFALKYMHEFLEMQVFDLKYQAQMVELNRKDYEFFLEKKLSSSERGPAAAKLAFAIAFRCSTSKDRNEKTAGYRRILTLLEVTEGRAYDIPLLRETAKTILRSEGE